MSAIEIPIFGNEDVFYRVLPLVGNGGLCSMSQVCKAWNQNTQSWIEELHKYNELCVEGDKYSIRSWVVLSSTGALRSRDRWTKYCGHPLGKNPVALLADIDDMAESDPDSPGLKKYQTYSVVSLYRAVKRPICEGEIAMVDEKGRLKIDPPAFKGIDGDILDLWSAANDCKVAVGPSEIEAGISLWNMTELFRHPLAGKENGPVIRYVIPEIFEQCYACETASSFKFVRREVPEDSRNKTLKEQLNRLPNTKIAGILPLFAQCGFEILETGTCAYLNTPDGRSTWARTLDPIQANGMSWYVSLGGFAPAAGIRGRCYGGRAHDDAGAVPGGPAEA
jgi:hypothetical protein